MRRLKMTEDNTTLAPMKTARLTFDPEKKTPYLGNKAEVIYGMNDRQNEKSRTSTSTKTQEVTIEEFLVVENAEINRIDGLQQPGAHRLAFGIQQALHTGCLVGILELVLHGCSPFCAGRFTLHNSNIKKERLIFKGQNGILQNLDAFCQLFRGNHQRHKRANDIGVSAGGERKDTFLVASLLNFFG